MPEDPTRGVAGKSYLVTGAASGIGTAVTVWLSHHGARVALVDLNLTGAETVIRDNQLEGCVAIQADVTHEGDVSRAMDEAERAIGALSGVHLNAGYCPPSTPLADVELDDFEKTMAVNARSVSAFLLPREFAESRVGTLHR